MSGPANTSTRVALEAVLGARDLGSAHAIARDEIVRLDHADAKSSDLLSVSEAADMVRRHPATIRRWAAQHHLGRKLGAEWLLSRRRFAEFTEGGMDQ